MRIVPNHQRLRLVALGCWVLGAWWLFQPPVLVAVSLPPIVGAITIILAALILALGAAFWLLATDRQAGISLERKGVGLHLGHSSAFVSWENIAAVGATDKRMSLLALGSKTQLGIRLHNPEQYLQSFEARLPASPGYLGRAVRLVASLTGGRHAKAVPSFDTVAQLRRRTGYDIIIPEAQLGARANSFVTLLEGYRVSPEQRRLLPTGVVIGH